MTHRSNGKLEPVKGETVELRLPSSDVWYQESTVTDEKGGYEFQVCPPPPEPSLTRDPPFKPQWQVVLAGRMVPVEVRAGEAVKPVDFEIGAALTPP